MHIPNYKEIAVTGTELCCHTANREVHYLSQKGIISAKYELVHANWHISLSTDIAVYQGI